MRKKVYNVLVLGSSGVGKSAWINSIYSFFKFDTFEEALQNPVECVIPTSFQIADDEYEMHPIVIGQSENENFAMAESTTQKPQVYAFHFDDFIINLIDVPGIGNTRGVEADMTNVKAILNTVAFFDELHAICILLKSTDSKMNIDYKYCLNELLMLFDKRAISNLFFVFTNSRDTQFLPGNGGMVLRQYLKQLSAKKGIKIKTSKDTMYCIDNDTFRFQCAFSEVKEFRTTSSASYKASWVKSQETIKRLFQRMATLNPHEVVYTLSLNQARAAIVSSIQLLGLIQANAANFEDNMSDIFPEEGLRGRAGLCQNCECPHTVHMHDQTRVQRSTRFAQEMKRWLGPQTTVRNRLAALRREQEVVSKTMVQFAAFLKKNAIFEHNNAFEKRMKLEIQNAEVAADNGGDRSLAAKLRIILDDHVDRVVKMEAVIARSGNDAVIAAEDVCVLRDKLFDLPLHGEKIRELYHKNTTGGNAERNGRHHFVTHNFSLTSF